MATIDDILNGPENGEMFAEGENEAVALPNFGANEANGSSQDIATVNKPPKAWELPLRIPEIRKSSNNWSLASDAGLLLYLQEFSQKMIAKTSDLEKQVDGLVNETKSTGSRVHNVFNDFLMLANTQFIENRVYDDAEDIDQEKELVQAARKDESKTREQREAEVIPRVTKALSLGINVLDSAFEQLDPHIGDSDSDEEDGTYKAVDPILEPKDLYAHRALPYIIGTPAFMQDDDVGLAFSEEEDEMSEDEDDDDEGESDLSDDSEFSETESSDMDESDTAGTTRLKKGIETKSGSEDSDDGDLFAPDKSYNEEEEQSAKSKAPGYADELASKLGVVAAGADAGDADADDERQRTISETSSRGRKRKKEKEKGRKKRGESKTSEDNLFNEPAELEDEESPFNKKGLFSSSGGGLFDEDDKDERGLFEEKAEGGEEHTGAVADHIYEDIKGVHTEPRTTRSGRKIPVGAVALFGADGDQDLFGSSPQSKEAGPDKSIIVSDVNQFNKDLTKGKTSDVSVEKAAKGGLFDTQDKDDLFGNTTSKPSAPSKKESKGVDLFGNEEEDILFGDTSAAKQEDKKTPPKKKLPAGAVSIFGDAPNPLAGKLSPNKTPSDEEEVEERKQTPPVAKKPTAAPRGGRLFAEGKDEHLFASSSSANSKSSVEKKLSKGSLFDEDADAADIFAIPEEPQANRPKANSSLFDDLDDDEADGDHLFAKPQESSKKKKPVGGVALFGGADVFGSPPKKEPEKMLDVKTSDMRDRRTNTLSLFNDDDEKDELFASGSKSMSRGMKLPSPVSEKEEKQNRRRAKSKSVFDDEDVLFGNKNEEDPSVDLFGSSSPVSPEKPQDDELIYENSDSLRGSALFDGEKDDEDDNLFGEKPPPVSSQPPPVSSQPKITARKENRPSGGLFGGDDDDGDLFGEETKKADPQYAKPKERVSQNGQDSATDQEAASKRKKPVGGVSMFGGIDPLNTTDAAAKKNQKENRKKPSTPTSPGNTASSPIPESPGAAVTTKPPGFKSVGASKAKSNRVSALQYANTPSRFRPRLEVISRSKTPSRSRNTSATQTPPPRPYMPPPADTKMGESDLYLAPGLYEPPIPSRAHSHEAEKGTIKPPDLPPRSAGSLPRGATAKPPPASPIARRPPKPLPKIPHASNTNNNIPPNRPSPMAMYPKPYRKIKAQPCLPPPPVSILEHHTSPPTSPAAPIRSHMMNRPNKKTPARTSGLPCFRTISSPLLLGRSEGKEKQQKSPPPRPIDPPKSYNVFHCSRASPAPNPNKFALPIFDVSNLPEMTLKEKQLVKNGQQPQPRMNGFHKYNSPPMPLPKPTSPGKHKCLLQLPAPIRQSLEWSSGQSSPGWSSNTSRDSFSSESDFECSPLMQRKAYINDDDMPPSPVWTTCTTPDHDPPSGYEASSNIQAILRSALEAAALTKSWQCNGESNRWNGLPPSPPPPLTPPPQCVESPLQERRRVPSPPLPPKHLILDSPPVPDRHFVPVQSQPWPTRCSPPVLVPQAQRYESSPDSVDFHAVPFKGCSPIQSPTLPRWDMSPDLSIDPNLMSKQQTHCASSPERIRSPVKCLSPIPTPPLPRRNPGAKVQNLSPILQRRQLPCPNKDIMAWNFEPKESCNESAVKAKSSPQCLRAANGGLKSPIKAFVPLPSNNSAKSKPLVELPKEMETSVQQRRKAIEAFFNGVHGGPSKSASPTIANKVKTTPSLFIQNMGAKISATTTGQPAAGKSIKRYTPPSYKDTSTSQIVAGKDMSLSVVPDAPPLVNVDIPPGKIPTPPPVPPPPPIPPHGLLFNKPWRETAESKNVNGFAVERPKSPTKMPKSEQSITSHNHTPASNYRYGNVPTSPPRVPRWNHVKHVTCSREQVLHKDEQIKKSPSPVKNDRFRDPNPSPVQEGRHRDRSVSPVKHRSDRNQSPTSVKNSKQRDQLPSPTHNGRHRKQEVLPVNNKKRKDKSAFPVDSPMLESAGHEFLHSNGACVLSPKTRRKMMVAAATCSSEKNIDGLKAKCRSPSPVRKPKGPSSNCVSGTNNEHLARHRSPNSHTDTNRNPVSPVCSPKVHRKRVECKASLNIESRNPEMNRSPKTRQKINQKEVTDMASQMTSSRSPPLSNFSAARRDFDSSYDFAGVPKSSKSPAGMGKVTLDRSCSYDVLHSKYLEHNKAGPKHLPPQRPNQLPIVGFAKNGQNFHNSPPKVPIWDQNSPPNKSLPPVLKVSKSKDNVSKSPSPISRRGNSKVAPKPLPKPVSHSKASSQKSAPGLQRRYTPVPPPVRPVGAVLRSVRALQENLSIDPSALKPGAAPPSREVESEPVGFDKPVQIKTLDSDITKNRAKMSGKRRPPSRSSRHAAAGLSGNPASYGDSIGVPEEAYQDLPSPTGLSSASQNRPTAGATKPKSKPEKNTNLFGNDDLFGKDRPTEIEPKSIRNPQPVTKRTPPRGGQEVSQVKASPSSDDGDLFASSLPVKKEVKKTKPKKSVSSLNDGDLFADSSLLPSPKEKKPKKAAITVDSDLFGDSTVTKKASSKSAIDDDFLATAPSTKKEFKKQPVVEDDEDDLFGEKKETPMHKKEKSKTSNADTDLFSDTTDIFADIPSKPKEKKKKKKQDQGIFGDVPGDDIFASPSASAKPKKSKAKKRAADKKPSSGEDIFSTDAPSIFDDPLSAMKK